MRITDPLVTSYQQSQLLNFGRDLTAVRARQELLGGALVFSYQPGTTIPAPSYSDEAMTAANTNPLVFNAIGEPYSTFVVPIAGLDLLFKNNGESIAHLTVKHGAEL